MGTSFLCWNIKRKREFEVEIGRITLLPEIDADILLLIEAENVDDSKIENITKLKRIKVGDGENHTDYKLIPRFYSRLNIDEFQLLEIHTTRRLVFARLNKKGENEIIIGGLHFPSKLEINEDTQYKDARQLAADLKVMKGRSDIGHNNFMILGDFNMNPFEKGMIEPDAFNAVLSTIEAKNEERTNWYKQFDYFYNPMWSFLGDRNCSTGELKVPGTYYFRKKRDVTLTYWNIFDKVIMRPGMHR